MNPARDTRNRQYYQTYRSETKTIALCQDVRFVSIPEDGSTYCNLVHCIARITKEDRRLPLLFDVTFEPDGGSPADVSIYFNRMVLDGVQLTVPAISARDLILRNRSYIPIVNRIGNQSPGGPIEFPQRKGVNGVAIEIDGAIDAAEIELYLPLALGDYYTDTQGRRLRYGGRWQCGYSITCTDRMAQEEWDGSVQRINLMISTYSNSRQTGTPILCDQFGEVNTTLQGPGGNGT